MRVGVVYFGMLRSAPLCIESIREQIIKPNTRSGVSFTSIASLNLVEKIDNPRSGEADVSVDPSMSFLLEADHYLLSPQRDHAIAREFDIVRSQKDPFENEYRSICNSLHQLNTLKRGWNTLKRLTEKTFDYYLFLRPDLLYLDKLDIPDLVGRMPHQNALLVPAWHSWGGLNDRFALAAPIAAEHYALRMDRLQDFIRFYPMHPETLNAWALAKAGCFLGELPVRAKRVRASAGVVNEDFSQTCSPMPQIGTPFRFPPLSFAGAK